MTEPRKSRVAKALRRRDFLWMMLVSSSLAPSYLKAQTILRRGSGALHFGFQTPASKDALRERVTSSTDFFIRNHFGTPKINAESWNLEVAGMVSTPLKLSYSDIVLLPTVRRTSTLECAGNVSGGIGVGNAVWSGLPLAELLKQAGVRSGATTVVLHGTDSGDAEGVPNTHFARAIPLEKAMEASTLLAYEMNDGPLPADHGFPLRALVSGWYGMDSVKWLTRIELVDQPFQGYFQLKQYTAVKDNGERRPITRMRVNSKFLRPSEGEEIRLKSYRVEGVAWAGERKISKVEFRVGSGGAWQPVNFSASPVALTWTPWSYDWHIPGSGQYTLDVRATDDAGDTQPDSREPDRQDAYELNTPHRITVTTRL